MKRYNEAIRLIQQQEFFLAEKQLKSLLQDGQAADEVKWVFGLVQIYLGRPQLALSYWERISNPAAFRMEEKKQHVLNSIPAYEKLYAQYNEALSCIHQKQFEEAFTQLKELINFPDALPLEIYEAFINTAYYLNETEEATNVLQNAPKHILTAPSIHRARLVQLNAVQLQNEKLLVIEQTKKVQQLHQQVNSNKKVRNGLFAGVGVLAAALLATVIAFYPGDEPSTSVAEVDEIPVEEQAEPTQLAADGTNDNVKQLEAEVAALEQKLQEVNTTIETFNQKEALLLSTNVSMDSLIHDAQNNQYQVGYQHYRNGRFEQAKEALLNSREFEQDVYYADDALYYLIQTKKRLGEEDLQADYEQFITSELSYFKQSPYYDDVLLQYAEDALHTQKYEQAKQLLQRIKLEFPQEWTALKATTLLNELAE